MMLAITILVLYYVEHVLCKYTFNLNPFRQARQTRQNSGGGGCRGLAKIRQGGGGGVAVFLNFFTR